MSTLLPFDIVVSGPTASGKSNVAKLLAKKLSGEVVNCDSVQLYKGHKIGSALPSEDSFKEVPHHLYEVLEPDSNSDVGSYLKSLAVTSSKLRERGVTPVLSGGTTLYIQSWINGLSTLPKRDDSFRSSLESVGTVNLYEKLKVKDSARASELNVNDRVRIIRALEIEHLSGKSFHDNLADSGDSKKISPTLILVLLWPRTQLYDHINKRSSQMISNGIVEEARALHEQYGESWRAKNALGYKQSIEFIQGKLSSKEELSSKISQATRRYAKRQLTFWRNAPAKFKWQTNPSLSDAHCIYGLSQGGGDNGSSMPQPFPCFSLSMEELCQRITATQSEISSPVVWYLDASKLVDLGG